MSIRCVGWALNEAPVTEPVQVLVLVAMAERANDDGSSTYQSRATIAQKARISVRTVQRILIQLEELGLIVRGDQELVSHFPANRRPVVYDICMTKTRGDNLTPQDSDVSLVSPQEEARGDIDDTLGVTQMAHNPSPNSSYKETTSVSTSPEAGRPAVTDGLKLIAATKFEEFWSSYPKQEGKESAKHPYWEAIKAGIDPDLITEKAKGYARLMAQEKREPKYIQHASRWLTERKWNDTYPEPPKKHPSWFSPDYA